MEAILNFLRQEDAAVVVLAILINLLTGLIKLPLKKLAARAEEPARYTRYLTFLPVILGFFVSVGYDLLFGRGRFTFDEALCETWLASSGLSLAIYAFAEKFIPSRKKILSEEEAKANGALVEALKEKYLGETNEQAAEETVSGEQAAELSAAELSAAAREEAPACGGTPGARGAAALNNAAFGRIILREDHDKTE